MSPQPPGTTEDLLLCSVSVAQQDSEVICRVWGAWRRLRERSKQILLLVQRYFPSKLREHMMICQNEKGLNCPNLKKKKIKVLKSLHLHIFVYRTFFTCVCVCVGEGGVMGCLFFFFAASHSGVSACQGKCTENEDISLSVKEMFVLQNITTKSFRFLFSSFYFLQGITDNFIPFTFTTTINLLQQFCTFFPFVHHIDESYGLLF